MSRQSRLPTIRKIDLLAYVFVLFGLSSMTEAAVLLLGGGSGLEAVGRAVWGLSVLVGGLYARANPRYAETTEQASTLLYVVAGVETVAVVVLFGLRLATL
ncbi:hypothetical protein SAMN04487950_1486 [Halogranum rubrum]|uniref:Uncharacterized protein n=1 Tax=Halogranum rubrum TaxID=553466 RepID=A0A1I4CZH0_9EURY|nr:hypothetical protein [Halogranum rubrum]SFK86010.1 hypothetical protein SAMN04487950_1486 [Halogranum rubrum]